MKPCHVFSSLIGVVLLATSGYAQSDVQLQSSNSINRPNQLPVPSLSMRHPAGLTKDTPLPVQSFYQSKEQWQHIIDSTWGPGLPLASKLNILNGYLNGLTNQFDGFQTLGISWGSWDSYKNVLRSRIDSSTSRGAFAALMSGLAISLRDGHTCAWDTVVMHTPLAPGVPLLCLDAFAGAEHFGAVLTALPDSTALVLRAIPNHPLGLQPGDIILGYEGVPWKYLVKELMDGGLPVYAVGVGARSAEIHSLIRNAGNNWHLFATIDILQHSTGDTLHLSVQPLQGLVQTPMMSNEQLEIPGIPFAQYWLDPFPGHGQQVSHGIIPGTNIGYVQLVSEWPEGETDSRFFQAVTDLWNSDGLIIDMRWNSGGWALFNSTFNNMFSQQLFTLNDAYRSNSSTFSLTPVNDQDFFVIPGSPGSIYDRPIAVLLGPTCVSMGDITAHRFRHHPMVRFFGKPSTGSFGDNVFLGGASYDGWWLHYSICDMYQLSQPGIYLNRSEFPVDEPVWFNADDVAQGVDPVLERALDWITTLTYAYDVQLSHPTKDTLQISARVTDPLTHSINVSATLRAGNTTLADSLPLYDDGLHGDGAAGDSVWSCQYVPSGDAIILATIRAEDLSAGTFRTLPDAAQMTFTRGPQTVVNNSGVINLGTLVQNDLGDDTTIVLRNEGFGPDSLVATIYKDTVPADSVLEVSPTIIALAPGDSAAVTVTVHPFLPAGHYGFRVSLTSLLSFQPTELTKWFAFDVVVTGIAEGGQLPDRFALEQNYPNPFNPTTTVHFSILNRQWTILKVYDVVGREVATLVNEVKQPGTYTVQWDATGSASGVYFYRLQAGDFVDVKKLVLLR
jgi:hypothetical protein